MKKTLIYCSLLLSLTGCSTLGPNAIRREQRPYNESIISSWKEQLLLNIVRLRYREEPYFLEVASINTSFTLGAEMSLDDTRLDLHKATSYLQMSPGIKYETKPTITYAPLIGENFVKQILSPMPPAYIFTLAQSGWSIDRIFNLCVNRINNIDNASNADGPTPAEVPVYREFDYLTANLGKLQKAQLIDIGKLSGQPTGSDVAIRFNYNPKYKRELNEIYELLNLERSDTDKFRLIGNFLSEEKNVIKIRTRSILGMMFYLSQAVEIPQEHIDAGLVNITRFPDGTPFNWNAVAGREMIVRCCKYRPCATVQVCYKGYWYYIDDADLHSKATFMILSTLVDLQAGQNEIRTPLLTLPVG